MENIELKEENKKRIPQNVLKYIGEVVSFSLDDLTKFAGCGIAHAFNWIKILVEKGCVSEKKDGVFTLNVSAQELEVACAGIDTFFVPYSEDKLKELAQVLPFEASAVLGILLNNVDVTYEFAHEKLKEICKYDFLTALLDLKVVCKDGDYYYSTISLEDGHKLCRMITASFTPEDDLVVRREKYASYKWKNAETVETVACVTEKKEPTNCELEKCIDKAIQKVDEKSDRISNENENKDDSEQFKPTDIVCPYQVDFDTSVRRNADVDVAVVHNGKSLSFKVPIKFFTPAIALKMCLDNSSNRDKWAFFGFGRDMLAVDFFEIDNYSPDFESKFYLVIGENEKLEIDGFGEINKCAPKIVYDMLGRGEKLTFEIELDTKEYHKTLKCRKAFPCEMINKDGVKADALCSMFAPLQICIQTIQNRNDEDVVKRFFGVESFKKNLFIPIRELWTARVEVCGKVKEIDPEIILAKQLTDEEIDALTDKNFAVFHVSFCTEE